jgi:hypothetical protein
MATAAKFVLLIPILFAYLVPLDVDVTGNITAKICEIWSESLSDTFLGDALIKRYETLQEYHMPCEVVL